MPTKRRMDEQMRHIYTTKYHIKQPQNQSQPSVTTEDSYKPAVQQEKSIQRINEWTETAGKTLKNQAKPNDSVWGDRLRVVKLTTKAKLRRLKRMTTSRNVQP